jgi:hypothetical protein
MSTKAPEPDDDTAAEPEPEPTPPEQPHPGMLFDEAAGRYRETKSDDDTDPPTRAERRQPRDAERYREQLRLTEQQRDRLQDQVDRHDKRAAERDVARILPTPSDLWCGGITIEDCRDEDGNYSPDLAMEAAKRVAKAHPNWTVNPAAPASLVGWSASKPETAGHANSFEDAFRPTRR